MADAFSYRVKFTDIRVKPPKEEQERQKAVETRECHRDDCDLAGDHPAPKPRGLEGVYWFCQKHAGEYNRNYDFFAGMSDAELEAFNEMARHGFQKTWKFGTGPMGKGKAAAAHDPRRWRGKEFFEENAEARQARRKEQQRLALPRKPSLSLISRPAQRPARSACATASTSASSTRIPMAVTARLSTCLPASFAPARRSRRPA
jgi:hypothetical protein